VFVRQNFRQVHFKNIPQVVILPHQDVARRAGPFLPLERCGTLVGDLLLRLRLRSGGGRVGVVFTPCARAPLSLTMVCYHSCYPDDQLSLPFYQDDKPIVWLKNSICTGFLVHLFFRIIKLF
jgi:hypothetical protein